MKVVYVLALTVLVSVSCLAENLVPGGDFTQAKKDTVGSWCRMEDGKFSLFNEDLTWNNCLKLEVDVIRPVRGKFHTRSAVVAIGGANGVFGFPVKPDTVYEYSIDLKGGPGAAKSAGIDAMAFTGEDYWRDRVRAKMMTPSGGLALGSDWTTFRGKFRTPSGAKRVSMRVSLWSTDEYTGSSLLPDGAFVLIDNVRVEESRNNLGASPADVRIERKKAVAVGDEFSDFLFLSDGTPAADAERTTVRVRSATADGIVLDVICKEPDGIVRGDGRSPWSGDNVEIWFGATAEGRVSSQFAVGASGATACALNGEPAEASLFSAKTKVSDGQWGARVTIPPSALGLKSAPPEGTFLPFNVGRQRRGKRRYLTWNRLGSGFGDTGRFGTLVAGSYAAGLKCRFGIDGTCTGREAFETAVAEAETAALKARFAKFANRKVSVAPVPVTGDFTVPYLPEEIFDPPDEIRLTAAVNEMKPLPLAIANLTDRVEDYVITLETCDGKWTGDRGLKGFPSANVTFRKAIRMRDTYAESNPTLRFDGLPKADGLFSVTVAPKEAGLAWIDFDTTGVAPGTYSGRLRVIPTCERGKLSSAGPGYDNMSYSGEMQVIPVTLEVRPITLSKRAALPGYFYMNAKNESCLDLAAQVGGEVWSLSPWGLAFSRTPAGDLDPAQENESLARFRAGVGNVLKWSRKHGYRPYFCICYSCVDTYPKVNKVKKGDAADAARVWQQWVKGVRRVMNDCGIGEDGYELETYDEPKPARFDEILRFHRLAKEAEPNIRLMLTLGATRLSPEQIAELSPVTDAWTVWDSYFSEERYRAAFAAERAKGKTVSHYTCSTTIRESLDAYYRKKAWFGEFYGLTGNAMYQLCEQRGGLGAWDYKEIPAGGIMNFMYGEAVPTIRFMAFREGVTDLKYLDLLRAVAGNDPQAKAFLDGAAKRAMVTLRHDPKEPDRLRARAAELLLKTVSK